MKLTFFSIVFLSLFSMHALAGVDMMEYPALDDKKVELNVASPKRNTLLIFWASWCSTCMAEIPEFKRMQREYKSIRFIGVNVNKNPQDGLNVQVDRQLTYPSISDPNLELTDRFKIRGTPGFVLLDQQGGVVFKGHKLNKKLIKAIESLDS